MAQPSSTTSVVGQWPCLGELSTYRGCVGLRACAAQGTVKCWSGHYLATAGERLLHEIRVDRYTPAQCATCANAVDAPEARRHSGRLTDTRLVACTAGLWTGLCSVYNLHNHRIPLKPAGDPPCPRYKPAPELRPELVQQRRQDAARSERLRQRKAAECVATAA